MSLQKREIAAQIVQLQEELTHIVAGINEQYNTNSDYANTLRLRAVVIEQEIDQLQKQFSNIKEYEQ